jgi:Protein of unknown function C-terminal (DUF3324)/Bacterial protein of unknown function (DUF916)
MSATDNIGFLQSRRCLAALVAVAALAGFVGPTASAGAAGPTFALKPATKAKLGYFVLAGQPGATLRGKVEVINVGSKAGKTSLYAVDATTGQTSGAVYRSKGEPRPGVGGWIKLGKSSLELGPGQSQVVPFSVQVPSEAAAGQHLGAIVAQRSTQVAAGQTAPGGKKKSGFKVKIQALSVLAVQVNVPGPERPRMTLSGIKPGDQPGHQSLLLGIGNTGNVLVKGTGSLRVVDHSGRQVQSQSFNLDTFVPETQIDFPVYIRGKALAPGRYRGTVSINYRGRSLTRTFPFTITAAEVAQTFGSQTAQTAPIGSSNDNTLLYILIVVTVLSLSAAFFFFWRNRRLA